MEATPQSCVVFPQCSHSPSSRQVFEAVHGLSHPDRKHSQSLVSKFVWYSLKKDYMAWADSCMDCQYVMVNSHTNACLVQLSGSPSLATQSDLSSDRGSQFTSTLWNAVIGSLGVKLHHTAYHPQANGLCHEGHLAGQLHRQQLDGLAQPLQMDQPTALPPHSSKNPTVSPVGTPDPAPGLWSRYGLNICPPECWCCHFIRVMLNSGGTYVVDRHNSP